MSKYIVNRSGGYPITDSPEHPVESVIELEDSAEVKKHVEMGYLLPYAAPKYVSTATPLAIIDTPGYDPHD